MRAVAQRIGQDDAARRPACRPAGLTTTTLPSARTSPVRRSQRDLVGGEIIAVARHAHRRRRRSRTSALAVVDDLVGAELDQPVVGRRRPGRRRRRPACAARPRRRAPSSSGSAVHQTNRSHANHVPPLTGLPEATPIAPCAARGNPRLRPVASARFAFRRARPKGPPTCRIRSFKDRLHEDPLRRHAVPTGDYALVLPAAGKRPRPALDRLGAAEPAIEAALKRQRFDGEAGTRGRAFPRRRAARAACWWSAPAADVAPAEAAEKLGGTAAARLLTSGETHAVIDLTGLGYDADAAARVALAAALRGWRYDRYRTRLKDKQKPTLTQVTIVGARRGRAAALGAALAAGARGRRADPRAGHRAGQHHLSGKLRRARAGEHRRSRPRARGARRRGDGQARHGRAARRRPGLGARAAAAGPALERRQEGRARRSPSSARA